MSQKKLQAKINILNRQVAYLDEEKERVERYLNDPYRSSENEKFKNLQNWLDRTKNFINNGSEKKLVGQDVEEQHGKHTYSIKLCLNYQRSKKAERNCKEIGALVQEARTLLEDIPRGDQNEAVNRFMSFESIKVVLDEILEAVQCRGINIIGVYGESGTGKTMLVREVKNIAEKQKLFDAVVMASVKGNPRIQDEIARQLGVSEELTNQEASNPRKVRRLTEKKVLLILDDIWEPQIYLKLRQKLPLEDENENRLLSYKILLTTRDSPVISDLSEIQFEIKPLEEREGWKLFEKIATYRTERRSLPFYADEICKKCCGLPITIATLAKALNSGKLRWKSTLQKLQSYPSLHLAFNGSYDCLKTSELQRTFLLCSLMGHNAAVQDLLQYTMGLDLFPGVKSVEEARDALLNSMTKLKYSSLLLDSGGNMHFDMHDLLMIFAKSIAFGEVGLNNWDEMESINWIHLSNTNKLPIDQLNCPQLTFFHLSEEDPSKPIPPDLFTGTRELRVLGLTKTWSMPRSISLLNHLQTLRLYQSLLRDADMGTIIEKLENLRVLSLVGCDLEELPGEIGQLANLKLLDLSDCTKLNLIPPDVLSRLSELEELYMRNSFDQWAEGVKEQENKVARLSELKQLPKLTSIEVRINICNIQMITGDLFSKNLARYKIFEGDMWHSWDSSCGSSKILKLKLDAKISSEHSVKKLLKNSEELHLQGLNGVNNIVNELDEEGFQELKYLFIQDAQNVQHIINSMKHDAQNIDQDSINSMKPAFPVLEVLVLRNLEKMEKICHGLVKESSFSKLRTLTVEFCNQLKNLFSSSIAKRNLLQLQEIRVTECSNLEEIVDDEEQRGEDDILKELRSLRLEDLPKLISFNSSCKRLTLFKSLKKLQVFNCPKFEGFIANTQTLFNEQVKFPNMEFLMLSSINIKQIWHISSNVFVKNLKKLFVEGCGNLEYLLTCPMVKSFEQLMMLKIYNCKMMEGVIKEEERMHEISFPKLDSLELEDLPKLTRFYFGSSQNAENTYMTSLFHKEAEFPKLKLLRLSSIHIQQIWDLSIPKIPSFVQNLKKLFVEGCGKVKYLLTSSMVMSLNQLIWLKICDCEMMEVVINSEESKEETISFPELLTIELVNLPKLTRFYHAENIDTPFLFGEKVGFPKLKFLSLSSIDIHHIWQISIPKISLEKLFVKNCGNLKYLLLPSMIKSFEQLMVLKIGDCKMMEQVISNELVEEEMICKSFFSKLDTLELEDLPKLARLCHGNYSKFKFSKLRQFTISKCAVLKTLIGDNAVSTENVENTYTLSLLDEKVEFPKLKRLVIKFMGSCYKIWDDKHDVNSYCQLNSLTVDSCEKLLNIFPFSMLERVRQKLETLEIQNCDSLEEIFGASQPQAQITTQPTNLVEIVPMFVVFPELTHINLSGLPKLKGFIPQMHINEWPSLKQLRVHRCDEAQIFASILPSFLGINENDKLQIRWISKRILLYKRSGRICYMLPARHLVIQWSDYPECWRWFKPDPRFPEVAELHTNWYISIHGKINTRMLSPKTHYKAYLVFKLANKPDGFKNKPLDAAILLGGAEVSKRKVYELAESGIVGNGDQYPKERGDNWFEVELGEIEFTKERGGDLEIHLEENIKDDRLGIIIQGMEIRPT